MIKKAVAYSTTCHWSGGLEWDIPKGTGGLITQNRRVFPVRRLERGGNNFWENQVLTAEHSFLIRNESSKQNKRRALNPPYFLWVHWLTGPSQNAFDFPVTHARPIHLFGCMDAHFFLMILCCSILVLSSNCSVLLLICWLDVVASLRDIPTGPCLPSVTHVCGPFPRHQAWVHLAVTKVQVCDLWG